MASGTSMVATRRQEQVRELRDMLDRCKGQIAQALPTHMTPDRMARVALTACQRTPQLLDCDVKSVIGAVMQASQLGLEPDGVLGHAYLVPYKGQCQLIVGYRGLIDLTRRSGQVSTIYARIVYKGDDYDFAYGLEPTLRHVPSDADDPGPMVAVYAVCRLRDGGVQYEWMWKRQVDLIRKRSPAGNGGPWVTDYEEMAKKTVLRRLCKMLPVSVELTKASNLDELAEAGMHQHNATLLDTGTVDAITDGGSKLERLTNVLDGGEVAGDGEFDIAAIGVEIASTATQEALTQVYNNYCGPESALTDGQRDEVSKLIVERRAVFQAAEAAAEAAKATKANGKKAGQGQLLDKGSAGPNYD